MRNISDRSCRENQNTNFIINVVLLKIVPSGDNVEKYCTAGQAIDDGPHTLQAGYLQLQTQAQNT
jgi:hypothetical protein